MRRNLLSIALTVLCGCGGPRVAGRPAGLPVVHARLVYHCDAALGTGNLTYRLRLAHPGEDAVAMQYARIGKACVGVRHDLEGREGPPSLTLYLQEPVACPGESDPRPRPPVADWPTLPVTIFYELDGREVATAVVFTGGKVASGACDALVHH
jgi:hypothetical protein